MHRQRGKFIYSVSWYRAYETIHCGSVCLSVCLYSFGWRPSVLRFTTSVDCCAPRYCFGAPNISPTHLPVFYTFLYQFNYFKYFYEAHAWRAFNSSFLCPEASTYLEKVPYVLFAQVTLHSNAYLDMLIIMVRHINTVVVSAENCFGECWMWLLHPRVLSLASHLWVCSQCGAHCLQDSTVKLGVKVSRPQKIFSPTTDIPLLQSAWNNPV